MVKRGFDLVVSAALLFLTAPILLLAAAAVAITSPGPVLFRQERAGRGFRRFTILKLRTMLYNAPGLEYTLGQDPRITWVGKILRAAKIDELPQLWNVLCGDMSLVGPRPVIPSIAEDFFIHYRLLLRARPGLTDPASLKYRRETELLKRAEDCEDFFRHVVTPDKINISLAYMEVATLWSDVSVLFMTGLICMIPSLSRLYGRPPKPPTTPGLPLVAEIREEPAEALPIWARTDTSLIPQAAEFRMVEDFTQWTQRNPWNLLPKMKMTAQSSRRQTNRSVSRL
jgi:lipopolysaccharide/colanic/teichoic acid biosynthesis glycosyltransferase